MSGSRPRWAPLAAFALAGVLLGALAAFVVGDRSSSDPDLGGATPAVARQAPTPELPTSAPTTEPEPTQRPADEPTAIPADPPATSVTAFGKHVAGAIKEGAALLESLRADGQAFDVKAVRSDADALADWADHEASWLVKHPPASCYADVRGEYANAIDDFGEAAKITQRFAKAFPFADFDELQRALDLANAGSASMQTAVNLLQQVRC